MPRPPATPDRLPSIVHNGTTVEAFVHYGFCKPDRGPAPKSRVLYGARDANNERHWRSTLDEMVSLIDRNFATSGVTE